MRLSVRTFAPARGGRLAHTVRSCVHAPCPCGWRWGMTPLPSNRRHIPCPCGRRASANWMGTVNLD